MTIRRSSIIGAAIAVVIALSATAWGVFHPDVLAHYATSPDSVGIARWAQRADADAMLRWWTGTWIQADSYYYRPLSSYLFWAEWQLFGWHFQGYVVISWLIHAAICLCVYFLALRIFPGPGRLRVVTGVLAVLLVNVRLGPAGPGWPVLPVAYSVVAWWPAQTDQASLLLTLLALLSLDRWLQHEDRRGILKAGAFWVTAVLFKEMAVIAPVLAGVLIILRRGWSAMGLIDVSRAGEHRFRLGLGWRIVLPAIAATAVFLAARPLIVPGAWGVERHPLDYYLRKIVYLTAARPHNLIMSHGAWQPTAAIFTALCIAFWVRLPRRPSTVWLLLAIALGDGLIAQIVGGNFALMTIPTQLGGLGTLTLFALGLIVLAHVREGWPWGLLAMALAVHIPLLSVWGPHYFYWPAAFWGLFNAGLWHWVLLRAENGTLRWGAAPQTGAEQAPDAGRSGPDGEDCFDHFRPDLCEHNAVNGYLLALASCVIYPRFLVEHGAQTTEDARELFISRLQHWGLQEAVCVCSGDCGREDVDTQVAVARNDAAMVVVFQGSQHPSARLDNQDGAYKDWIVTDLNVNLTEVSELWEPVRVHSGFWHAFSAVSDELLSTIMGMRSGDNPSIWIAGHSLGGALAMIAALWLQQRRVTSTGTFTLGAPRVGDHSFARLFAGSYSGALHRYVHEDDPVPLLPPDRMAYVQVGAPHVISREGELLLEASEPALPRLPLRHRVEHYVRAFYDLLPEDARDIMPRPPSP